MNFLPAIETYNNNNKRIKLQINYDSSQEFKLFDCGTYGPKRKEWGPTCEVLKSGIVMSRVWTQYYDKLPLITKVYTIWEI